MLAAELTLVLNDSGSFAELALVMLMLQLVEFAAIVWLFYRYAASKGDIDRLVEKMDRFHAEFRREISAIDVSDSSQ